MIPAVLTALGAAAPLVQLGFEAMREISRAAAPAIARALSGKVAPKAMEVLTVAGRIVGKVAQTEEGTPGIPGWTPSVVTVARRVVEIVAPVLDHVARQGTPPDGEPMVDIAGEQSETILAELAEAEASADAASQALADAIARQRA